MLFKQLFDGETSTLTYLLVDAVSREAKFIDKMSNLHLPSPKKIVVSVPANLRCSQAA